MLSQREECIRFWNIGMCNAHSYLDVLLNYSWLFCFFCFYLNNFLSFYLGWSCVFLVRKDLSTHSKLDANSFKFAMKKSNLVISRTSFSKQSQLRNAFVDSKKQNKTFVNQFEKGFRLLQNNNSTGSHWHCDKRSAQFLSV